MDCEKVEPLLLDELYDELDELTSAAVKRHVAGCARCAGLLQGMRATRRAAVLPVVDVPEGLEDRILAAAKEAQKVVPLRGRVSRAVSWAGSWAMRPQTAMAAVFLLMIGSSAFLLRSNRRAAHESAVSVTVAGEPTPSAPAADHDTLTEPAAAAAHGAAAATASPAPATPTEGLAERLAGRRGKDDTSVALGSALPTDGERAAKAAKEEARPEGRARGYADEAMNAGPAAGAPAGPQQAAAAPASATRGGDAQDSFSAGMAAYRARDFAEATRQFDSAAASGELNAALWAAKSARDGNGCGVALGRFDAVAQRGAGTWHGAEAELEAARCEMALGHLDAARERLRRLSTVASHAAQAHKELAEVDQIAARRARSQPGTGGGSAGAVAAPKAATRAAPAPAPTTKAPAKPAAAEGL